jgi:hypothetical protein
MRTLLLATLLVLTACKKKEEPKADPAAEQKEADKAAEPAKPGEGAPAAGAIVGDVDYETKATDMTNKLLAVFGAAGKDCDKLAADLTVFTDQNRTLFEALKAYEQAHPDAEKKFDEKMKPREKEFEEKLGPAMEACQNHEGLKKAMNSMPLD